MRKERESLMSFMDSLGRSKVNTKDVPVQRVGPLIVAILAITMVAFIAYISMSEILYDKDRKSTRLNSSHP